MACTDVVPAGAGLRFSHRDDSFVPDPPPLPLPKEFVEFLLAQNVDPRVYYAAQTLPRYIRAKPSHVDVVEQRAEEELGVRVEPVPWLPGFFKCPSQVSISGSRLYKEGQIYGMDVASGAAVMALDIRPRDHVLDVCAAPGAKLCMIAEIIGAVGGTVTGVDISRHRLAACRTMLQKYGVGSPVRLFLADGTTFQILPLRGKDTLCGAATVNTDRVLPVWRPRKSRKEKRIEQRASKKAEYEQQPELFFYGKDSGVVGMELSAVLIDGTPETAQDGGYDKVLVDAECTHDGSLKHICKFEQWGWETFEKRFFNRDRVSTITALQLKLVTSGFKLLKRGGTLVYSTCSFTYDQNEGVVKQFLATNPNAEVSQVEGAECWPCKPAGVEHCLRFDPLVSNTNGQFVAKFVKV